jgi:hypothetical protein
MMVVQVLLLRKNSTFLGAHGGLLNALVNVALGDDQQVGVGGRAGAGGLPSWCIW